MRRWTMRVLCWLALGAGVNVAVAWAPYWLFALYSHPMRFATKPIEAWSFPEYVMDKNWPPPADHVERWWWDWTMRIETSDAPANYWMKIECCGWPARSMRKLLVVDPKSAAIRE